MGLDTLQLYGCAVANDGSKHAYKIVGCGDTEQSYNLVLEVTNVHASYISHFTLEALIKYMDDEIMVRPPAQQLLGWLHQHLDRQAAGVRVLDCASGGLQLEIDAHDASVEGAIPVRVPPQPMLPLGNAAQSAWVAQEVLFSAMQQLAEQHAAAPAAGAAAAAAVDATSVHQLRIQAVQQVEECRGFLAAAVAANGTASSSGAHLVPPRVACQPAAKRKSPHEAVSGSAVKAPRPSKEAKQAAAREAAVPGAAVPPPPAAAGAAGGTAAAVDQAAEEQAAAPSSTQQTGGMSSQSRRTDVSEVGKAKRVAGRGRGRGIGGLLSNPPSQPARRK